MFKLLDKKYVHFMSFLNRTFHHLVRGKKIFVSREARRARLKVCGIINTPKNARCIFLNTKNNSCNVCGCNIAVKSMFATDSCDLGKWEK